MKDKVVDLFGTKYTIKFVKDIEYESGDHPFGYTSPERRELAIRVLTTKGESFPKEEIELTLLHELVHAILLEGAYVDLSTNENLVEWIAKCIRSLKAQKII